MAHKDQELICRVVTEMRCEELELEAMARLGHSKAVVELWNLANFGYVEVFVVVINEDGTMADILI